MLQSLQLINVNLNKAYSFYGISVATRNSLWSEVPTLRSCIKNRGIVCSELQDTITMLLRDPNLIAWSLGMTIGAVFRVITTTLCRSALFRDRFISLGMSRPVNERKNCYEDLSMVLNPNLSLHFFVFEGYPWKFPFLCWVWQWEFCQSRRC